MSPEAKVSPAARLASRATSASPLLTPMRTWKIEFWVPLVRRRQRLADRERRPNGAFWVVLVCRRGAEDGQYGVADVLHDGPAALLELLSHESEKRDRASRCTSSTSIASARLVNPTRSAKSTVITLRSSRRSASAARLAPQWLQKRPPARWHGGSCRRAARSDSKPLQRRCTRIDV